MDVKNASAAATAAPPELAAIVSSEVARQLDAFKQDLQGSLDEIRERTVDNRATIVVFSGDLDKVLAGFVIATGAAAAGLETSMFFTFWGLAALKKKGAVGGPKNVMEKMFGMMTPASSESLGTSKMNFFGMGAVMRR